MPHIIVKLWPGRTENQKLALTEKIAEAVREVMDVDDTSISVAFEEIPRERWARDVYKPDIIGKESTLYKKPGYILPEE